MQKVARNEQSQSRQKVAKHFVKNRSYFHQQNKDKTIKANEDQDFSFCGGSWKSRFEWLEKSRH